VVGEEDGLLEGMGDTDFDDGAVGFLEALFVGAGPYQDESISQLRLR
jgi:hypothetical protein